MYHVKSVRQKTNNEILCDIEFEKFMNRKPNKYKYYSLKVTKERFPKGSDRS